MCTWDFPRGKIPHTSAYTISEKAIRFQHLDYNPDRAQTLISSSMSQHLSTRHISPKSMHVFLSNLANRQTDRQTDRQTNEHRQKHLHPPFSEVTSTCRISQTAHRINIQLECEYHKCTTNSDQHVITVCTC